MSGDQQEFGNIASGNFLGEIKLRAKFDVIVNEHVQRAVKPWKTGYVPQERHPN